MLVLVFLAGHTSSLYAQPRPFNKTVLARVDIRGCKKIESEKLLPLFSVSAPYDSAGFGHALERMRSIYHSFGFYDFRIDSTRIQKNTEEEPARIDAAIFLTEGDCYVISEIEVKGNKLIPASELTDMMNTRKGGVLDMDVLEKDFDTMLQQYEQIGRPFAKITLAGIERISADKNHDIESSLHIALLVEEGPYVRINGYKISGNTTTEPQVITRELQFHPGDGFNGEKFTQTRQRIEKLGFFEKVKDPGLSALNNSSRADTLDGIIEIAVVEGNQNTFDGIVGYQPPRTSTETGYFTGFVNIALRNMFGTGRQLSVLWNKPTKPSQDIKLRYLEPWLFGIPLNAAVSFRQLKQDTTYSQFDLGLNLTYKIADDFYLTAMVASESITPIVERKTQTQQVLRSKKFITGLGVLYDSRDYPRSPRSGLLFRNEYQIGSKTITAADTLLDSLGIRRSLTQQRILLDMEFYRQLFRRQVLAIGVHGIALIADQVEVSDLIRFGGSTSLRGYREQQFVASQLIYTNLEYRFLLSRDTFAFLFYDIGTFFKPRNPLNSLDGSYKSHKSGYGFGFRVESPLGILGISYALGEGASFLSGVVHFGIINEF